MPTTLTTVETFLSECQLRGVNRKTYEGYKHHVAAFLRYMNDRPLTPPVVLEWAQHLQGNGYAPATVQLYRRLSLNYLNWLSDNLTDGTDYLGCIKAMRKLKAPRCTKTRYALTIEQVQALLSQPYTRKYKGLRDRIILEIGYATLRISEILALEYDDIDMDRRTIRVREGKGNKERYLPMPDSIHNLLTRYIGKVVRKEKLLPLSYDSWLVRFRAYKIAAGLPDEVTPHFLRHSGATHMHRNGCPIAVLSKILGHSEISTTERYLDIQVEDLVNGMSYHPLSKRTTGKQLIA